MRDSRYCAPGFTLAKSPTLRKLFDHNALFITGWIIAVLLSFAASLLTSRRYLWLTGLLLGFLAFQLILSLFWYGGRFGP